jgi:hypothetical protein
MFQNLYAKGYAYTGCHIMQYSIFYILFFKVNTCTNLSLWENGHTKSWLCLHYYFLWIQYAFPWPKLFSIHQVDTLWSFLYTTFNDGNAAVSKIFLKNMQVHICWYARTNILTPVPSNIFLLYQHSQILEFFIAYLRICTTIVNIPKYQLEKNPRKEPHTYYTIQANITEFSEYYAANSCSRWIRSSKRRRRSCGKIEMYSQFSFRGGNRSNIPSP